MNLETAGGDETGRVKAAYARYMSPEVTEYLLSQQVGLSVEEHNVGILVLGIGNFATVTEGLRSSEMAELLDRHYDRVVPTILENNGRIDKYYPHRGGILATFGVPIPDISGIPIPLPNPELSAVIAARSLRDGILKFNSEAGNPEFDFRIAVSSGLTAIGIIGSKQRLEYTVVGESVTLAHTMIALARRLNAEILIDENTRNTVHRQYRTGEPHEIIPPVLSRPHTFYALM